MEYIFDTIDIYFASVSFWVLCLYFILPILLNMYNPIPNNIAEKDRDNNHWSVFYIKYGYPIWLIITVSYFAIILLVYQGFITTDYDFPILKYEIKNSYYKFSVFLILAIFIQHKHYFSDLHFPGINDEQNRA